MLAKAEEICTQQPKPQNPSPLILRDGGLVDFEVERSSPVFTPVQRARRVAASMIYTEQEQMLEKAYQDARRGIFVAGYTLTRDKAGDYVSYPAWTKGVPTLLPKTDRVMFIDTALSESRQGLADAPWSRVLDILPAVA